ncbi:MAG: alpha/beta fold hydrolase [Desulfobacterales bacterium]|nr:alpha/beta fold hydrolase [Desulfobacterales bacterium]
MLKPSLDISPFRHLYPFSSHFMDVGGHRLHYLDEGAGEPVLMVHGNPTWSFYYRVLVKGLSAAFRTIVPDHIGCGLSDKPGPGRYDYRLKNRIDDLGELIDRLEPERKLTLIVHDWGGMIGMAWAVNHPNRIGRIVVTNTAAFPPPAGKAIPLRLSVVRNLAPLAAVLVLGFNAFARGAVCMAPKKKLSADVRAGLLAPYNSWKNRIATLRFVQDIPLSENDPGFTILTATADRLSLLADKPMLICWGMHDFVFDADYLEEWRRRFPEAQVHRFEQAGHYLLEDEPACVLETIRDFLQKTKSMK